MDRLTQYTRDGLTFDVTDAGPLDGPVIVLLHGFPGNRGTWSRVAPLLHDAGYRTLAPDQRGYSPGAAPHARGRYRPAELARDTLALLDAAGTEKVHLVGHDWGGFLAWELALVAPQRFTRLTVASTPHPAAFQAAMTSSDQLLRSLYMVFFQLPVLPERWLEKNMVGWLVSSGLSQEIAEDYAATMRRPGMLTAALNWYRGAFLPGGSRMDPTDPRVRIPTTYVWGRRDVALGRRAAELTRSFVRAPYSFVELVEEGHWLPELAPEALAREILADVAAPS